LYLIVYEDTQTSRIHILEDKHTLVAGFKASFRINISEQLWNRRKGKLNFLSCRSIKESRLLAHTISCDACAFMG